MSIWVPTCYKTSSYEIKDISDEFLMSAKRIRALLKNEDAPVSLYEDEMTIYKVYRDVNQRIIIESLLLAPDINVAEIGKILDLEKSAVELYKIIFFDIEKRLGTKIGIIGYIETGLQEARASGDEFMESMFMFKKWSITLGKEFIMWKFSLTQTDMSTASLYNTVIQEAFFYHKEKSLSDSNISTSDYQRSVNSLLSGLKTRQEIAEAETENATSDFMENLDIIIQEDENTDVADDFDNFINNVDVVSKEELEEVFKKEEENE
jgi:hypothetical protein